MYKLMLSAATAAVLLAGSASAQSLVQTSDTLANVNGSLGSVTATTTTDATGRATTVTGPGGGSYRYGNAAAPKDLWQQQNVGGNATVGITTAYARSGNGSAYFQGQDGNSKADLEIYFANPVALSSVTGLSYDLFRDASSTAAAHLTNSLRLMVGDANGVFTNTYLIFEPVYNGNPVADPITAGQWNSFAIDGSSTFWANNGNLNEPAGTGACSSCYASLADWQASNAGYTVVGLSTGIGSGFSGSYQGAVDNIVFSHGGTTTSWNFEAAATGAVPEPATWGLMILGFGAVGATLRRRSTKVAFA